MTKHPLAPLAAVAAITALCGPGAAHAQAAGDLTIKVGWNKIIPHVKSGDLSPPSLPGSRIDIKSATALYLTLTYMITDQLAVEALGGLPYKHTVVGAGTAAGVGRIGSIHQISPTVLLEWKFMAPADTLRPYLGVGPTFAKFYKTEGSASLTAVTNPGGPGTRIGGDTEWGATVAAGADYKIDKHWSVNAAIFKTLIKTKAPLSTGQTIDADLDPVSINASVGYRF